MNKYKKKLIKNYVLQVLLVLSLLMITIPMVMAAFRADAFLGIWTLGCCIGFPTLLIYSTDND